MNFLDPQLTSDGLPYGPTRYKEIIEERYYISKFMNTSYGDTGKITPTERRYLLTLIKEDQERIKSLRDAQSSD